MVGTGGAYHDLLLKDKRDLRFFLVKRAFGTQTAAARFFGVDPSLISHIVCGTKPSTVVRRKLQRQIGKRLGPEFEALWAA